MKWIIRLLSLFILSLCAAGLYAQSSAEITLAGYKQVPPVHSPGSGVVTVTLRSDTLMVEGHFQDLRGTYRSASIHYGSESESGNRLLGLRADIDEDYNGGTFRREENEFVLRPSLLEAARDGNLYIIVGSDRYQRGEIRGQIPPL